MAKRTRRKNRLARTNPPKKEMSSSQSKEEGVQLEAVIHKSEFRGPLPPPEILAEYEKIHPGFADRVIQLTEKQGDHRREMQAKVLAIQGRDAILDRTERKRGQYFGFIVASLAIICGTVAIVRSSGTAGQLAGGALSVASLTGLVIAFITGRRSEEPRQDQQAHKE